MRTFTVQETTDYSIFVANENNRTVDHTKKKFKKLLLSIKKHGFLPFYPVWCKKNTEGKLSIQVGHHRFEAAKQLKKPVCYMVYTSDFQIWEEGLSTSLWNTNDHLSNLVSSGDATSLVIKNYHESTGISVSQCLSIFSDWTGSSLNNSILETFKAGNFKIHPAAIARAQVVKRIVDGTSKINKEISTQCGYISAILKILCVSSFDVDRYLSKLLAHSPLLEKQINIAGYIAMIEQIYNRKVSPEQRIPVAFLTKFEMQKRSIKAR
jgi:hypothetical protein